MEALCGLSCPLLSFVVCGGGAGGADHLWLRELGSSWGRASILMRPRASVDPGLSVRVEWRQLRTCPSGFFGFFSSGLAPMDWHRSMEEGRAHTVTEEATA